MAGMSIRWLVPVIGVCWVGGWGYLMFRFPEFFGKMNARVGLKFMMSPKALKFIQWTGIVEMAFAGVGAVNAVIMIAFGYKW
jgi:hypothetical protein